MSKELLNEIAKTAADLAETNRQWEEAQKNALALETQARHIRTVVMPELKEKRAELQTALVHQRTISAVNDATAIAQEEAAKATEARRNQDAALKEAEELRKQLKQDSEHLQADLAELRAERKAAQESKPEDRKPE